MQSLLSLTSCFSVSCVSSTTIKTIVLPFELLHCGRLWICSEQPPPLLVPSSTLLWLRLGRRLLQSLRGCCTSTSPATAAWFTAGTCSAGHGLMSLCVVPAVDSTSSQGTVKFYYLVHLGQFPRFPVRLGLVRCSTSRLVLFFLCNVVLAWRISSSFSWTNVFWKSWNL